jgi:DNA-binding transcriptional MerR regulator
MNGLIKIREVSSRYGVSARTLRYYEDRNLITSVRNDDNGYRLYDAAALNKLEQILILRKLNVNMRDIKRIFETAGSEVVLEVLGKKVEDIDGEVALLHELKEIVLDFIGHIKKSDFTKESDVKLLYDKAREIEANLAHSDYEGNPGGKGERLAKQSSGSAHLTRLSEVAEKLDKKVPDVMVIKIPAFRAVTSGLTGWDEIFGPFQAWHEAHQHLFKPVIFGCPDFLTGKDDKAEWLWGVKDEVTETDTVPYKIITFPGGLYAVMVSVDEDGESHDKVRTKMDRWLETTNFIEDETRTKMGHMIYPHDDVREGLGYHQLNLYLPIRLR